MASLVESSDSHGPQSAQVVDTHVYLPVELGFALWYKSFRKQRPVIW